MAKFEKGHKLAKGGKREGSGRKPDAFKEAMQTIADSPKFIAWLKGVIDGDIEADPETRIKAWREARDSGYGKPMQAIEHKGKVEQGLGEDDKNFIRASIKEFICKP